MFKTYKRTNTAEMRPVTDLELAHGPASLRADEISISQADLDARSPKTGDMIARNPTNHKDQWLVNKQYVQDNFEALHS